MTINGSVNADVDGSGRNSGILVCRRIYIMTINKALDGNALTISLSGRLDTTTAPELEEELKSSLDGVSSLTFDFKELAYISSAGLRVLLSAQKTMNKHPDGAMKILNSNDEIKEIFEVTGFSDILNIE